MYSPSAHKFLCGFLLYVAATAYAFVVATRNAGYGVVVTAIVAIGVLGLNVLRRGGQDAAERAGAKHAAR